MKTSVFGFMVAAVSVAALCVIPGNAMAQSAMNVGLYGGRVYVGNAAYAKNNSAIVVCVEGSYGIYYSTDGGSTWSSASRPSNGIRGVVSAASGFYAASGSGGVQKSTDNGATWVAVTHPSSNSDPVQGISIDDSDKLYVITESKMALSSDGGTTWADLAPFPTTAMGWPAIAAAHDGSAVYAVHDSALWKYAAEVFTQLSVPAGVTPRCVTTHPSDANIVFVNGSATNTLYRSTNGGSSWDTLGLTECGGYPLVVDHTTPTTYYCNTKKSTDSGATWNPLSDPVFQLGGRILWVDPDNSDVVWGRNDRGPVKSADGGGSFAQNTTGIDSLEVKDAVQSSVDATIWLVGTFHGLAYTADGGSTWSWKDDCDTNVMAVGLNGTTAYCYGARGACKSIDSGVTWTNIGSIAMDPVTAIYVTDTGDAYFAGNSGIIPHSGGSWGSAVFSSPVLCLKKNGGIFFAGIGNIQGTAPGGIYTSPDGSTWTQIPELASVNIWDIAFSGSNIYAGSGTVDMSGNASVWIYNGSSWSESILGSDVRGNVAALLVDPSTATTIYSACQDAIYVSVDSGVTWNLLYFDVTSGVTINVLMPPTGGGTAAQKAAGVLQDAQTVSLDFGSSKGYYKLSASITELKLTLTVSPQTVSIGDRITILAHVEALDTSFDAWAVILLPNGAGIYSMLPNRAPQRGARPVALSVPRLASTSDFTLLDIRIPGGIPNGQYIAAVGLFPAGIRPTSLADAQSKAIAGYFDQKTFTVN